MSNHLFNLKRIYLFGHRQQNGKDTCANLMYEYLQKKGISCIKTSFAKTLKKQVAERYCLSVEKMEFQEYKLSKPEHLGGKTVRDILIEEGNAARLIWKDVWAFAAYKEIFSSNVNVGIISDFRYENECDKEYKFLRIYTKEHNLQIQEYPLIKKILVNRLQYPKSSDIADNALTDDESYYDYVIYNKSVKNWFEDLENQIISIIQKDLGV